MISDLSSQNQMLTQLNQQGLIDSDIFIYQSNELAQQLQEVKVKKKRLLERDEDTTTRRTQELGEILENGPEKLDSFHAEYCRVSTDEEEQLSSYEAQKTYYTDKIMENPEWTMAGIFADEGITGTSAKKRPEFLRMIRLCKQKKIDIMCRRS